MEKWKQQQQQQQFQLQQQQGQGYNWTKNVVDVAIKIALQANISNCLANLSAYFLTAVPHICICCVVFSLLWHPHQSHVSFLLVTHISHNYNHNHTHNC